jgi:capsular exopolysaccharide synthesis family protein
MIEPSETPIDDEASKVASSVKWAVRIYRVKFLLRRYWWVVAGTMIIGAAIQGYRYSKSSPEYISTSRMMVNGQFNLSQVSQGGTYSEDLMNFYGTQVALMQSSDTVTEAMARVSAIHPEVAVDPNASVAAIQVLKTSLFNLSVTSTNPEYAPLLLDAVMDSYLTSKRGRKEQTTNGAVSAITAEIAQLDTEIRTDEQQLLDFQKDNNVVFIEEQSNSAATYLIGLNNELARLTKEHDLLVLESSNRAATDANTSADSGASNNPPLASDDAGIQAEQETIEKLKILRDDYSIYLKDMHPKMIALSDQIDKEQKFLDLLNTKGIQERDAHQEDLKLQIQNLEKQIVDWNQKSLDLNQRLTTFQLLKSKITREQAMYDQLASSVQNVHLNTSMDQEDVVIMDRASPASLIPVDYERQLINGALFGALAGIVILNLLNRLDDKVNYPVMIEAMYPYPVIGQIPFSLTDTKGKHKRAARVPLIAQNDPRHILVESYRNIRSSIFFRSNVKIQPKCLLIGGASPAEGKSSLTSNLGITFAFAGLRTLLIDADMRRGILHELFEAPNSPGLSDYLQQKISWREVVQHTKVSGLDLITRGKTPHHAGELLLSVLVDLLLQESVAEYDMVLCDSAPLLAADDTSNICSRVDGVIVVIRVNHSSIHAINGAMNILAQRNAKIFGLVLNGVKENQPGNYYDRYRYKQYYATEPQV